MPIKSGLLTLTTCLPGWPPLSIWMPLYARPASPSCVLGLQGPGRLGYGALGSNPELCALPDTHSKSRAAVLAQCFLINVFPAFLKLLRRNWKRWRGGTTLRSTCAFRGPGFSSRYTLDASQPPSVPVKLLRDGLLCAGTKAKPPLCWAQAYMKLPWPPLPQSLVPLFKPHHTADVNGSWERPSQDLRFPQPFRYLDSPDP